MPIYTPLLNLLKKVVGIDPPTDKFNVQTMMNDNWDKIDAAMALQAVDGDVRVATTGNITLSGLQTVDGVVLAAGDRVLVKNQTTGSQNGIYVAASGVWARAADADSSAKLAAGISVYVRAGTTNGGKGFTLSNASAVTLGTTALTFVQTSGSGLNADTVDGKHASDFIQQPARITTSGTDLNSLTGIGWYYCDDNTTAATFLNSPTVKAFSLRVEKHAGVAQTLTEYMNGSSADTWTRNYYGGTWGAWYRVYDGRTQTITNGIVEAGTSALGYTRLVAGASGSYVQALNADGSGSQTLWLTGKGGAATTVKTPNNTLDDGSGAATFKSSITSNGTFKTAAGASNFRFLTATDTAQAVLAGGLLASDDYGDASKVPTGGIYSKGQIRSASDTQIAGNYRAPRPDTTGSYARGFLLLDPTGTTYEAGIMAYGSGNAGPVDKIALGFGTTPWIAGGGGYAGMTLQITGKVTTKNNTLDDGSSGAATFASTVTSTQFVANAASATLGIFYRNNNGQNAATEYRTTAGGVFVGNADGTNFGISSDADLNSAKFKVNKNSGRVMAPQVEVGALFTKHVGNFASTTAANQKIDVMFSAAAFCGYIDISVAGGWGGSNESGIVTKRFVLATTSSSLASQNAKYIEAQGGIVGSIAISDMTWDATASQFKVQIAYSKTTVNGFSVVVEAQSYNSSNALPISAVLGTIYTTDTTVLPAPKVTSPDLVAKSASVSEINVTSSVGQAVLSFAPAAAGNFQALTYLRVTAATTVSVTVNYTDVTGAQITNVVSGQAFAVGSYSLLPVFFNATTAQISIQVSSSVSGAAKISASILGV